MTKVLFATPCFYPSVNTGGPAVSMTNLVKMMNRRYDCSVVTTYFDMGSDKPFTEVAEGENRLFNSDVFYLSTISVFTMYKSIKSIKPKLIYTSSLFSVSYSLPALIYSKLHRGCSIIVAPRGELRFFAINNKSIKKKIYIGFLRLTGLLRNIKVHTTSNEEYRELRSVNLNHNLSDVYNISNLSIVENNNTIVRPQKIRGELKMLTIGRFARVKNLYYAFEILSKLKDDIIFDIYGPKEDEEYFNECFSVKMPDNVKINYKGHVRHDELKSLYMNYHLFISPTLTENFGHSIVEAMLNNCPVIISNNTPWNDVGVNGAGYAIDLNNKDQFVKAVGEFAAMNNETYQTRCIAASEYIQRKLNVNETIESYYKMFDDSLR